jgi:4-hydroxy-3-polyprenylbenzoate decarboxylase
LDATNKIGAETEREWGRVLAMPENLEEKAAQTWERLRRDAGI